jgi:hypothetical protein
MCSAHALVVVTLKWAEALAIPDVESYSAVEIPLLSDVTVSSCGLVQDEDQYAYQPIAPSLVGLSYDPESSDCNT